MAKGCSHCSLITFLSLAATFTLAIAITPRNITIDDLSNFIHYSGEWSHADSPLAYDGAHAFSMDPNATASFTFTGVAIYYMAPRWAYNVSTLLTLDSRMSVAVSLMSDTLMNGTEGDLEVENTTTLWGQESLSNTEHTIVASMWANGDYVVMDALTYTVLDSEPAPALSSTSPVPVTSTHISPSKPPLSQEVKVLTTSIGVIAACLILAFLFYHRRRKPGHSVDENIRNLSPLSWHAMKRRSQVSSQVRSPPMPGRSVEAGSFPSDWQSPKQRVPTITPHSLSSHPKAEIVSLTHPPVLSLPRHLHDSLGFVFEPRSARASQDHVINTLPSSVNSMRPSFTHSSNSVNPLPEVEPQFPDLSGEYGRVISPLEFPPCSELAAGFYQIPQNQVPENSIHTFTTLSNCRYSTWSFPPRRSMTSTLPITQSGEASGESLRISPT